MQAVHPRPLAPTKGQSLQKPRRSFCMESRKSRCMLMCLWSRSSSSILMQVSLPQGSSGIRHPTFRYGLDISKGTVVLAKGDDHSEAVTDRNVMGGEPFTVVASVTRGRELLKVVTGFETDYGATCWKGSLRGVPYSVVIPISANLSLNSYQLLHSHL